MMKKLLLVILGIAVQLQAVENEMFSLKAEIKAFVQDPEVKKLWAGKEKETLVISLFALQFGLNNPQNEIDLFLAKLIYIIRLNNIWHTSRFFNLENELINFLKQEKFQPFQYTPLKLKNFADLVTKFVKSNPKAKSSQTTKEMTFESTSEVINVLFKHIDNETK